jgi:hypothetical protein
VVYSFFYVNVLSLITLNHLISITNMTFYIYYLTFSPTFFAYFLNLLYKSKANLLHFNSLSFSLTSRTLTHVSGIISSCSSAMRTYYLFCNQYFYVISIIYIFQTDFYFHFQLSSFLLLFFSIRKSTSSEKTFKNIEWVIASSMTLFQSFFSILIIFFPFFRI